MASIPLPALNIQPPANPLDQYAKALSVKSMMGGQQLQQEQIKGAGLENESRSITNQQEQLALDNAKIVNSASSDPETMNDFKAWQAKQSSGTPSTTQPGGSSPVALHPFAQFLNEEKGLPLMGKGGALEVSQNLQGATKATADALLAKGNSAKVNLENYKSQLGNLNDQLAPIVEASQDPKHDKQDLNTQIAKFANELKVNSDRYPPDAVAKADKITDAPSIVALFNSAQLHEHMTEDATKQAEEQTAKAAATQKTQAAAGIRDKDGVYTPQARSAMDTIKNYAIGSGGAIPPAMVAGLTKEMQNAPDMESLQGIQKRADSVNESFQRSADARAQASAIKDVGIQQTVAGKLVAEDQKLGTALDQTGGIRQLLDMSKGGNETATNAAQVRFAEHEIVEGGVKRMNQAELQGLTQSLGTYGRQFQAWMDKGFQGAMPPATNKEMQTILDAEDQNANVTHERNIGYISNRYVDVGKYSSLSNNAAPKSSQSVPGPGAAQFHYQGAKGEIFSNDGKTWYDRKGAPVK